MNNEHLEARIAELEGCIALQLLPRIAELEARSKRHGAFLFEMVDKRHPWDVDVFFDRWRKWQAGRKESAESLLL